jgi:hypothetical protein
VCVAGVRALPGLGWCSGVLWWGGCCVWWGMGTTALTGGTNSVKRDATQPVLCCSELCDFCSFRVLWCAAQSTNPPPPAPLQLCSPGDL